MSRRALLEAVASSARTIIGVELVGTSAVLLVRRAHLSLRVIEPSATDKMVVLVLA